MSNHSVITFKLVALFDGRENYGAHCWDGEGECPQHWKNKGGDSYVIADGLTLEMIQDEEAMEALVAPCIKENTYFNEYGEQWYMCYDVICSKELSPEEEADLMVSDDFIDHFENAPIDKYDALAEALGF